MLCDGSCFSLCSKEKLLDEIMARVEDGELPDAAETEAHWSSFVATDISNIEFHTRDLTQGTSSSEDDDDLSGDGEKHKSSLNAIAGSKQRTKASVLTGRKDTIQHKRHLAAVDKGMV